MEIGERGAIRKFFEADPQTDCLIYLKLTHNVPPHTGNAFTTHRYGKRIQRLRDMSLGILEGYTRVFVEEHEVDQISSFYQELFLGKETQRFSYPEKHLLIAAVSSPQLSILIIGGSEDHRASFASTRLTIAVKSLDSSIPMLLSLGATQLEPIQATPQGRKTRFVHPDGLVVEYVENKLVGAADY